MAVRFLWGDASTVFVKCLESLPNLHTLEIGSACYFPYPPLLKHELKRVKLPQIKTLILPPAAHHLFRHCPNVEDVDWVIGVKNATCGELFDSLVPIRHSKIERLAIPLVPQGNQSRKQPPLCMTARWE